MGAKAPIPVPPGAKPSPPPPPPPARSPRYGTERRRIPIDSQEAWDHLQRIGPYDEPSPPTDRPPTADYVVTPDTSRIEVLLMLAFGFVLGLCVGSAF